MFFARIAEMFSLIGGIGRIQSIWKWWKPMRSMYGVWRRFRPLWRMFSKSFV